MSVKLGEMIEWRFRSTTLKTYFILKDKEGNCRSKINGH